MPDPATGSASRRHGPERPLAPLQAGQRRAAQIAAAERLAAAAAAAQRLATAAAAAETAPRTTPPQAVPFPAASVSLAGHGYGHGYGMGQWGAFGYAGVDHRTYQWIVAHYYGRTRLSAMSNPMLRIAISGNAGVPVDVTSGSAFRVAGHTIPAGGAALMTLTPNGDFMVQHSTLGSGCSADGWKRWGKKVLLVGRPVAIPFNSTPSATGQQVLELCRRDGVVEPVRGDIEPVDNGGEAITLNVLRLESYLRGVVPSEMPASWGEFGGPGPQGRQWGFQALEAQAVAARSYAAAYRANGGWFGYADICDFTDCQEYRGMLAENPLSDAAVADTAGQIMRTPSGQAAETQYSASTGGWTAGGVFPAVPDIGDSVCITSADWTCNPSHDWSARVPVSSIEGAFPQVGALSSLSVVERNGFGSMGGRVLDVAVQGLSGTDVVTGSQFAGDFGLRSIWFAVTDGPGATARSDLGGYVLVRADGRVAAFGAARNFGSPRPASLPAPIVGIAETRHGKGYWLVSAAGNVYHYGDAGPHGSVYEKHLGITDITAMAATPDGKGYWLVGANGRVYPFGNASVYPRGAHKPAPRPPIVGIASSGDGKGYLLVGAAGNVYDYGDAKWRGSLHDPASPVVGMSVAPGGRGYLLAEADGALTAFGSAPLYGSISDAGGGGGPVRAVALDPSGHGYLLLTAAGVVEPFGDSAQYGDLSSRPDGDTSPVVGLAAVRG